MKLIGNILKDSKEIIITYILSYVLIIVSCAIYTLLGYQDLDFFLNYGCCYILFGYYIFVIIYIYKRNKAFLKKEISLTVKGWYPLMMIGTSLAIFMNMIIFFMFPIQKSETITLPLTVISSGIIGPIYEELLFRFLFYQRLKESYSINKSMIISVIVFSLIHVTLVKMTYAFILGFILTKMYEKQKNILVPIFVHMVANTIVLLLDGYNTYVFLLSIISLFLGIKIYFQVIK